MGRHLAEERYVAVHLPVVPLEPVREDVVDPLVELLDRFARSGRWQQLKFTTPGRRGAHTSVKPASIQT
jgi:hypothetical protein